MDSFMKKKFNSSYYNVLYGRNKYWLRCKLKDIPWALYITCTIKNNARPMQFLYAACEIQIMTMSLNWTLLVKHFNLKLYLWYGGDRKSLSFLLSRFKRITSKNSTSCRWSEVDWTPQRKVLAFRHKSLFPKYGKSKTVNWTELLFHSVYNLSKWAKMVPLFYQNVPDIHVTFLNYVVELMDYNN